jgi:hypothetical protein
LYLNDPDGKDGQEPLKGGATTFYSWNMQERIDVVPKCGRVLMFQHRGLLHSGDDVVSGLKLTMRTDIMYTKEEEEKDAERSEAEEMLRKREGKFEREGRWRSFEGM